MNLLYTITSYPPSIGGAQLHFHNLALALSKRHKIGVFSQLDETCKHWLIETTLLAPLRNKDYIIDDIPVKQINLSLIERVAISPFILPYYATQEISVELLSKMFMKKIVEKISRKDIDIIHNSKIGREYLSVTSFKLSRKLNVPFVFTPNHHPRWEGWMYRTYLNLCRKADALIVLTENEKKSFVKLGVDDKKIFITGIGPVMSKEHDSENFKIKHGLSGPVILFLGQKYEYKGIDLLLKAARAVWRSHPTARFLFVGPRTPYSERLFKEINDERIIEIGSVDLKEKTSALAASDILCLPSSQESFGGVFLEAWMMKKPVIGGDIPAIRDVISDGKDGFISSNTPKDLAEKIIYLLDNPEIRLKMGERGYKKVKDKYSWDIIADKTEKIYNSLINSR